MATTQELLERRSKAIKEIGGYPALLDLPEEVKEILKGNYDLETKTKMFEAIAANTK